MIYCPIANENRPIQIYWKKSNCERKLRIYFQNHKYIDIIHHFDDERRIIRKNLQCNLCYSVRTNLHCINLTSSSGNHCITFWRKIHQ